MKTLLLIIAFIQGGTAPQAQPQTDSPLGQTGRSIAIKAARDPIAPLNLVMRSDGSLVPAAR